MAYFNGSDYFEEGIDIIMFFCEKSVGKTTWGMRHGFELYEKKGTSFAWIFNNEKECNAFKAIELKSLIDLNRYKIKGNTIIDKEAEEETIVCVLGNAKFPHYIKNYQNITTLFYDEFTRPTGMSHFDAFTNFITMVSNLERKKKGFKIYAFSNTITMNNAFFTNLDIVVPEHDSKEHLIMYKRDMRLKVMIMKQGEFFSEEDKSESLANMLASGNQQISSSLFGNQFNLDNNNMIIQKRKDDMFKLIYKFVYCIKYDQYNLILYSLQDGSWVIDYYDKWREKIIRALPIVNFTILDIFMDNKRRDQLQDNIDIFEKIENKIANGTMFFTTIEIRNIVLMFLATIKYQTQQANRR